MVSLITWILIDTVHHKNCGARKYPDPHHRGSLEILRGGEGVLKAKIFKGMYEPKLEFQRGGGFKPKKKTMGGVRIFSGTTHSHLQSQSNQTTFLSEWDLSHSTKPNQNKVDTPGP